MKKSPKWRKYARFEKKLVLIYVIWVGKDAANFTGIVIKMLKDNFGQRISSDIMG